jgi:hypothetical protein
MCANDTAASRAVRDRAAAAATLPASGRRAQMDQTGLVNVIDEALERFAGRDLVSAGEVVDFLLDLRSAIVSDAALAALLESESQPTR